MLALLVLSALSRWPVKLYHAGRDFRVAAFGAVARIKDAKASLSIHLGLAIGSVLAILAYVPSSPWEFPIALVLFLAGTGFTWFSGRRTSNFLYFGLDSYSGVLRWLLGVCAVLVCVIFSSGLVYASAVAMIGNTTWAGFILMLPAAGPMGIFSISRQIGVRNLQQELIAELEQESQEHMAAHEGETPHDNDHDSDASQRPEP